MIRYLCKICGRLAGQVYESCDECGDPLFCNLCGYNYDTDAKFAGKRVLIKREHRADQHHSVDLV